MYRGLGINLLELYWWRHEIYKSCRGTRDPLANFENLWWVLWKYIKILGGPRIWAFWSKSLVCRICPQRGCPKAESFFFKLRSFYSHSSCRPHFCLPRVDRSVLIPHHETDNRVPSKSMNMNRMIKSPSSSVWILWLVIFKFWWIFVSFLIAYQIYKIKKTMRTEEKLKNYGLYKLVKIC